MNAVETNGIKVDLKQKELIKESLFDVTDKKETKNSK